MKAAYFGDPSLKAALRPALGHLGAVGPTPANAFYRTNMPRSGLYDSAGDSGNVALTTQVMTSVPIWLRRGDLVTNLSWHSGATAAGTPTNWWTALYSTAATPALIGQSADQLTAAWAAYTVKTLALSSPYRVLADGVYWAALHVKATSVPSLLGAIGAKPIVTGERNLAQTSGSALAGTAPATIATPAWQGFAPLVVVT